MSSSELSFIDEQSFYEGINNFHNLVPSTDYADTYFLRTKSVLEHTKRNPTVTLQIFAKKSGIVAGIYEVIQMLKFAKPEIRTKCEGAPISGARDPVMHITGKYQTLCWLETAILGVLARRTLVASNMDKIVKRARGRPVIYMGARHDDFRVQAGDGYAALVGGASGVTTKAGLSQTEGTPVGTIPHSLIAAFGGDTVEATLAFVDYMLSTNVNPKLVALVDYDNDVIGTSIEVLSAVKEKFGKELYGVRVDTSEKLVDQSLLYDENPIPGVNHKLLRRLKHRLVSEGYYNTKIIVSGGITASKIHDWNTMFARNPIPVDEYGVGSSILGHTDDPLMHRGFDFTADIVRVDGKRESKSGRSYIHSNSLTKVAWSKVK